MRIYKDKYLSVTSILELKTPFNDKAFRSWADKMGKDADLISNTSKILGEKVSDYIEMRDLLEYSPPVVDKLEEQLFEAVDKFLSIADVIDCEFEVVCKDLNYAGRVDGLIEIEGVQYLADWKTYGAWNGKPYKRDKKKIDSARDQLSLYRNAYGKDINLAVIIFTNTGECIVEEVDFNSDIIKWTEDNQDLILKTIQDAQLQKDQRK